MLLGIQLTLLIGPAVPVPAPPPVTEALVGAEVTLTDEGRSGFQLSFQVGRSGPADLLDHPLLLDPLLRPFTRVILVVTFGAVPQVLLDGFVTRRQLTPSEQPGASTLVLTGEDVSVMMDLVEQKIPHPAQDESTIARMILLRYTPLLLLPPLVIPPPALEVPAPTQNIPGQRALTDLRYLNELAGRFGHVFHVTPGPLPGQNLAYWGPPIRTGVPQPALAINMGPASTVDQLSFQHDALAATTVVDVVQDARTNLPVPVVAAASLRLPPLALAAAPQALAPTVRVSTLGAQTGAPEPSGGPGQAATGARGGLTATQAFAMAQAKVDASADRVVTATGQLDAVRYGALLRPRGLVGLRGAGLSHDGLYYVKSVTHAIRPGDYKQRFTLTREGLGSTVPAVLP